MGRRRGKKPEEQKPKETEVNVDDNKINKADVTHIKTGAKGSNDVAWYKNLPELFDDLSDLPFNQVSGLPYEILSGQTTGGATILADENVKVTPGIMSFLVTPTIGSTTRTTDPANIAAQQMFMMFRKKYTASSPYDKTEVMMYIMAMDSAYMLYEELLRAYRLLGNYKTMNRYLPDAMLQAVGFAPKLADNLADFRGVIDLFAYQLASVNVPNQLDVIKRHSFMFSNVYKDSNSETAQYYVMMPGSLYVWTEGQDTSPTYLNCTKRSTLYGLGNDSHAMVTSLDQIRAAIKTVMDPILGSEDIGYLSSDAHAAFGDAGVITIAPVANYETLEPVYNMEVINQLMNATVFTTPNGSSDFSNNITQDLATLSSGPQIQCKPSVSMDPSGNKYKRFRLPILNIHEMPTDADTVMTSTRLMVNYSESGTVTTSGSEFLHDMRIYTFDTAGNVYYVPVEQDMVFNRSGNVGSESITDMKRSFLTTLSMYSKFDNAPIVYIWSDTDEGLSVADPQLESTIVDLDISVVPDWETIKRINLVAIMSLFKVKDYTTRI